MESRISPIDIQSAKRNLTATTVDVHLPKFEIEASYNLQDALLKSGMVEPFSQLDSDFSGISETDGQHLSISKVRLIQVRIPSHPIGRLKLLPTAVFRYCIRSSFGWRRKESRWFPARASLKISCSNRKSNHIYKFFAQSILSYSTFSTTLRTSFCSPVEWSNFDSLEFMAAGFMSSQNKENVTEEGHRSKLSRSKSGNDMKR